MEEVIVLEPFDRVRQREPLACTVRERHRHRQVQLDDRRRGEVEQPAVEQRDLGPVRLVLGVQGCDRRLQLVRARHPQRQPALERRARLRNLAGVPERPVLVVEEHESSGTGNPRVAACVLEEEKRVQPVGLRLVGHECREQQRQPDRLRAQLAPDRRAVARVEDEVDRGEDRAQPLGQQVLGR